MVEDNVGNQRYNRRKDGKGGYEESDIKLMGEESP